MKILIAISCLISLAACNLKDEKQTSSLLKKDLVQQQSKEELIERGKYLMITSACHDCHTPKVMTPHGPALDSARLLSGHPQNEQIPPIVNTNDWVLFGMGLTSAVGPWGVSFSANLTPDDTGTGNWTLEQFKTAIRKGKYKGLEGSRDLLPPMPWEMYKNMTDEDLTAIFTYLRSIPPVNNLVPAAIPPNKVNTQLTSN
jgi:mono/diheme cytochrome c family protein